MAKINTRFIEDAAVTDIKVAPGIDATKIGDGSVDNTEFGRLNGITGDIQTQLDSKVDSSLLGAANGVATLDSNGRVPAAQMQISLMDFSGSWNATTNTPTLADTDTGASGTVYRVATAGSIDLGSGSQTFEVDDWVYNDGVQWRRLDGVDPASTDQVPEGSLNLYYTEARVSANTDVAANTAARHDAVTLNSSASTLDTLSLTGQEITVNAATTTTAGAMSAADKSKLDGIEAGATADQVASEVPVTPAGNIVATDVQAALEELDVEKEPAITIGLTTQYYRGDKTFQTLDTDAVAEATNLYYTDGRVSANVDVAANTAARHDAVTLAAGATQDALSLSTQEITSNPASPTTAGHMTAADKAKLDTITSGTTGDLAEATFSLTNNQTNAIITGLAFANADVRSARVQYSILIDEASDLYEEGVLKLIQRNADWQIARESSGDDSLVDIDVTSAGQLTYTTPAYTSFVSGTMKFRATVTGV